MSMIRQTTFCTNRSRNTFQQNNETLGTNDGSSRQDQAFQALRLWCKVLYTAVVLPAELSFGSQISEELQRFQLLAKAYGSIALTETGSSLAWQCLCFGRGTSRSSCGMSGPGCKVASSLTRTEDNPKLAFCYGTCQSPLTALRWFEQKSVNRLSQRIDQGPPAVQSCRPWGLLLVREPDLQRLRSICVAGVGGLDLWVCRPFWEGSGLHLCERPRKSLLQSVSSW